MPRPSGVFAKVEVDFMRRLEFLALPVGCRWFYIALWCYAVARRRERLPNNARALAQMAGINTCHVRDYLSRLETLGVIEVTQEEVNMKGVVEKHRSLFWNIRRGGWGDDHR